MATPQPGAGPGPEPTPGPGPASTPEPSGGPTTPRHTSPITPLVHAVRIVGILLVIGLLQLSSSLKSGPSTAILGGLAVLVVVALVIAGIAYLQWTRLRFWFDADGDLRVSSGVLQTRERRLHLSRLQSVEVVQPLLARVFGMAEVRVEVAGGDDARITLSYLTLADATALRAETLARAAGLRPDTGEAPEAVLVEIPAGTLFKSTLLSTGVWVTWTVEILVLIAVLAAGGWAIGIAVVFTLVLPLFGAFGAFTTYFNFTVADSPDGLRTRFGLFGVKSHTIPPGRVASIEFVEPFLWRRFGWVSVRLTVAGIQGKDENDNASSTMLLPVATWDVATAIVARILPGVDIATLPLAPVPDKVRRRSPFQWRKLGLGATPEVMATRRGWLTRRTTITPHARVQSVRVTQGPWERSLGLASVHADIVPGPIKVVGLHRPASEAREFAVAQVARLHAAARADTSTRWARGHHASDNPQPGRDTPAD